MALMAALTIASANDFLNYALRGTAPSWGGASTLYVALHTGAVGSGGDQTTSEVSYTGYARVAIARTGSPEFAAASGGATDNDNQITFGNPTAGSFPITATHISIGESASGAGTVLFAAALASPLVINLNVQPNVPAGALDVTAS
jgi:hypothetical protein